MNKTTKTSNKAFKIVPIDFLAENINTDLKEENLVLKQEIENLNQEIFNLKNCMVSLNIEEFSDNQFTSDEENSNNQENSQDENEYYEITENGVNYYTDSFDVYEIDEEGDPGEIVGTYVDGSVIFF